MSRMPLLSINEFNKPKILESADADTNLLYYIVIGRDTNVTPNVKFDINKYRFGEIENSKSDIETSLRNHITSIAPEIYLDNITVSRLDTTDSRLNKTIFLTLNIIKQSNGARSSIFFKITNKDTNNLLVDLIK